MASFTLGNAQLANHKAAPAVGRMQLPQMKANTSISFGPKLGCRTQAFNVRRSGAVSASRQQPLVVAMAAEKGYKVSTYQSVANRVTILIFLAVRGGLSNVYQSMVFPLKLARLRIA